MRRRGEAGLSLVEVLVGLAIVSVLAGAVVVGLSARPDPVETEAERLAARFAAASESALTGGRTLGFRTDLDGRGYVFLRHDGEAWVEARDDPALDARRLPEGVRIEAEAEGAARAVSASGAGRAFGADPARGRLGDRPGAFAERAPESPEILFDPAGFDEPAQAVLIADGSRWTVRRGADGAVSVEPPEPARGARRGGR